MVPRDLHLTLQPQAPTFRASLQRALQDLFVDGSGTGYLKSVCDYVHLNPARARLLSAKQRLSDFRWSSYGPLSPALSPCDGEREQRREMGPWGITDRR